MSPTTVYVVRHIVTQEIMGECQGTDGMLPADILKFWIQGKNLDYDKAIRWFRLEKKGELKND